MLEELSLESERDAEIADACLFKSGGYMHHVVLVLHLTLSFGSWIGWLHRVLFNQS